MNRNFLNIFSLRNSLVIASLAISVAAPVYAADSKPEPEAHSDGLVAVLSDTTITAKIKTKLAGEDALKKSYISVTTTNGVVTLEGSANTDDAKALATSIVQRIEGVKSVDNTLKVASNSKTEAKTRVAVAKTERAMSDSWITAKVKSEILADSISKGFSVEVTTVKGVVVLEGTLATQDGIDHVKDLAAKVKGVKSVDITALTLSGL